MFYQLYTFNYVHIHESSIQCSVHSVEGCQDTERYPADISAEGAQVHGEDDAGEADDGHADGAAGTVRTEVHEHV